MPKKQKIYKKEERNCGNCINLETFQCPHIFWMDGLKLEKHYCNSWNKTARDVRILKVGLAENEKNLNF